MRNLCGLLERAPLACFSTQHTNYRSLVESLITRQSPLCSLHRPAAGELKRRPRINLGLPPPIFPSHISKSIGGLGFCSSSSSSVPRPQPRHRPPRRPRPSRPRGPSPRCPSAAAPPTRARGAWRPARAVAPAAARPGPPLCRPRGAMGSPASQKRCPPGRRSRWPTGWLRLECASTRSTS